MFFLFTSLVYMYPPVLSFLVVTHRHLLVPNFFANGCMHRRDFLRLVLQLGVGSSYEYKVICCPLALVCRAVCWRRD